jgi:hypothetical protein
VEIEKLKVALFWTAIIATGMKINTKEKEKKNYGIRAVPKIYS